MTETKTPRKRASRAKPVPPAEFSAPETEQPVRPKQVRAAAEAAAEREAFQPSQDAPGFKNGKRLYETVPESATPRCVERGGCEEQATQQVARRPHIRYCPRHGAEFEVRQQYVIDPWELEPIR